MDVFCLFAFVFVCFFPETAWRQTSKLSGQLVRVGAFPDWSVHTAEVHAHLEASSLDRGCNFSWNRL